MGGEPKAVNISSRHSYVGNISLEVADAYVVPIRSVSEFEIE